MFWKVEMEGLWELAHLFFERFAHFHFRSHLQTLINRESHQIKLYQSQRGRRRATGTDVSIATLSCHLLLHSFVCLCCALVLGERKVPLLLGRPKTWRRPTFHPCSWLCVFLICRTRGCNCPVCVFIQVVFCACALGARLYARLRVKGDKRAFDCQSR